MVVWSFFGLVLTPDLPYVLTPNGFLAWWWLQARLKCWLLGHIPLFYYCFNFVLIFLHHTLWEPTFSASTITSSLSKCGYSTNIVLATCLIALVAIPLRQYLEPKTLPSSPLHLLLSKFLVTKMAPMGWPLRQIALNHGWGITLILIKLIASSLLV